MLPVVPAGPEIDVLVVRAPAPGAGIAGCVWLNCKSPGKSKSSSCLRGSGNSCGGTAGRALFGEGEHDHRVSICACFIWIHLAPSLQVL